MRYVLGIILLCLCGPCVVAYGAEEKSLYLIEAEADETGETYIWNEIPVQIATGTPAEEAYRLFEYFFETAKYCVPEGVRILGVKIEDGTLTLNVSNDILRYGGNAFEQALLAQCVRTALFLPEVERFTLLIEGLSQPLTEGRMAENLCYLLSPF